MNKSNHILMTNITGREMRVSCWSVKDRRIIAATKTADIYRHVGLLSTSLVQLQQQRQLDVVAVAGSHPMVTTWARVPSKTSHDVIA